MEHRGAAGRAAALRGDLGRGVCGPVGERMRMPPFRAAWPVGKGAVTACLYAGRPGGGPRPGIPCPDPRPMEYLSASGCFPSEDLCGTLWMVADSGCPLLLMWEEPFPMGMRSGGRSAPRRRPRLCDLAGDVRFMVSSPIFPRCSARGMRGLGESLNSQPYSPVRPIAVLRGRLILRCIRPVRTISRRFRRAAHSLCVILGLG